MIEPRYRQQTLYEQAVETFMPDHKKLLWEGWMLKVDELLEADELVEIVHQALQQRQSPASDRPPGCIRRRIGKGRSVLS